MNRRDQGFNLALYLLSYLPYWWADRPDFGSVCR